MGKSRKESSLYKVNDLVKQKRKNVLVPRSLKRDMNIFSNRGFKEM